MILELEPRHNTETPSRTHNERICETTPEETGRSVPPGAARNRATGEPGTAGRKTKTRRETSPQHTDEQQKETMQTGLRVLARMIARAHLRAAGGAGGRQLSNRRDRRGACRLRFRFRVGPGRSHSIPAPYQKTARNVMPQAAL